MPRLLRTGPHPIDHLPVYMDGLACHLQPYQCEYSTTVFTIIYVLTETISYNWPSRIKVPRCSIRSSLSKNQDNIAMPPAGTITKTKSGLNPISPVSPPGRQRFMFIFYCLAGCIGTGPGSRAAMAGERSLHLD